MYSPDDVFAAASAIRPYLPELLQAPEAQALERQLEVLLGQTEQVSALHNQILDLLTQHDITRDWIQVYLTDHPPVDDILKRVRTYHPLPDKRGDVTSPRYVCPVANCHQAWYRRDRNQEIPPCPIHNVQMVRASKGEQ